MEKKMHQIYNHGGPSPIDLIPLGVIAAAWVDVVPSVAALFAIGWYCILMWESDTVRGWTGREIVYDDSDEDDDNYLGIS